MTDRYSNIKTGTEISKESLIIDSNIINNYLNAINDSSRVELNELEKNFIPPMCIAALSLRGVINKLKIPGGTIHTTQELEFTNSAKTGEKLECIAKLILNSIRGDWRFLTIGINVTNKEGKNIMYGKSNIMLPHNNKE